jgi:hypothetical protein
MRTIKHIELGPITVGRRYDQERGQYVTVVTVGRVRIETSEREATHNEVYLASLMTPNEAT